MLYGVKTGSNPPSNARKRSTLAHTIHKCTRRIHRAIQKCTREIHTRTHNPQMYAKDPQGDTKMHARDPHTRRSTNAREICTRNPSKGKCIIVSLLTKLSSNTVVPLISCTTNHESFCEFVFCINSVYK